MAFESLTEKLQNVFKNLRSKGRLTEADVKTALKEVKMALLEADVSFKVVKQFIKSVQEQAVGQDVMNGLNPGQMVIKIVNDELVKLMGSETTEIALRPASEVTIIMMAGLQGAGKTTTTAKIAGKLKAKAKSFKNGLNPSMPLSEKMRKVIDGYDGWSPVKPILKDWFGNDYELLMKAANDWRNELAHEKRTYEPDLNTVKAVRLVEHLNYCIVLRTAGYNDDEISAILERTLAR